MEDEKQESYSSLLRKINSKPLIMEKIFSYSLSRPNILLLLISKDKKLVNKLNEIFRKIPKTSSGLEKEFMNNLFKYSKIKELNNAIEEYYQKIQKSNVTYHYLENKYNFSFMNYLFGEMKKYLKYNFEIIDEDMIKGLIYGFFSTLNNAVLTFLPQKYQYLDGNYIFITGRQNQLSQEKYRNKQKIKLIILFDQNCFFNNIYYTVKLTNIEEIEIIFEPKFAELNKKNIHQLHIYLNNYLSKIEYLDCISKIYFHNNDNNNDNDKDKENELYQSLLGYLFEGYFSEKKEDILQQIRLMTNLKSINIGMTYFYIYEKIKLFYYIYELFPLLNKKFISEVSFSYNINNKILIINNSNAPLKSQNLLSFIDFMITNNDIEFLFIVNHNKLIIEVEKKDDEKNIKTINLSKLREFCFINEKNDDIKNLMDKFTFNNDKNYHIYEGYDKDKNLILYRVGETNMQSFDLIDIFKNNKIIEKIDFITEEIVVKFNIKRNNLQIMYNGLEKKEDTIINKMYFLAISNFTKFINYQNNLTELTINKFNVDLNNIVNENVKILNINYEKNISTLEYQIIDTKEKINSFSNLEKINIGSQTVQKVYELLKNKEMTNKFEAANIIISESKGINSISKLKKKFYKKQKKLNFEILNINNEKDEREEEEEEYENDEEECNIDYDINYNKLSDYL